VVKVLMDIPIVVRKLSCKMEDVVVVIIIIVLSLALVWNNTR
jgi:hypothetical protein